MTEPLPALLMINAHSRRGHDTADMARAALAAAGLRVLDRSEAAPDRLTPLIEAHRGKVSAVILGGGDGTLSAAARGLVATELPLGILPLGTANDLARTLAIPPEIEPAVAIIRAGHKRRIDVGKVNDQLFFNVAGIGLNVALTRKLSPEVKRRWGRLSYAWTLAQVVARARSFTVVIRHEGGVERARTVQVSVGNGRYYGGGFAVHDEASIDDGLMDLYSLEPRTWWQLAAIAPWLRSGRHGASDHVRTLRSARFEIHTRSPHRINTDGEITARTPAVFESLPGAVTVFVPEARHSRDTP